MWETPANWSTGSLPGPADDVQITTLLNPGATITHASDNSMIHSLTTSLGDPATIAMNGGTLTVAVPSTFDTHTTLNLAGGTMDGSGDWSINGPLNWTGGTLGGSGAATANGGLSIGGAGVKTLDRRILNLPNGGNWLSGTTDLTLQNGAIINNAGLFDMERARTFFRGVGNAPTFNNTGTFRLSNTTGTAAIAPRLINSGTVDVRTGMLVLSGGGSSDSSNGFGNFTVEAAPATLTFGGGFYRVGANTTVSGAGNVVFGGGFTEVDGSYGITGSTSVIGENTSVTFLGSVTSVGSALTITQTGRFAVSANFGGNNFTVPTVTLGGGGTLLVVCHTTDLG